MSGPAQNRVTPLGDVVAVPLRCGWTGNRGRLHEGAGTRTVVRAWRSRAWLTCRLELRGRRVAQWDPGHYTPLFLPDEAVALAAGHRPCGECRHAAYRSFRDAVAAVLDPAAGVAGLDRRLHDERLADGRRRLHERAWASLPDGAFVLLDDGPARVRGDATVPWTTEGYGVPRRRPGRGTAVTITPPTSLLALASGYRLTD